MALNSTCYMCYMTCFRSPAAPPDPRIYMLHMLRDFFVCHPAPAGPPILHATNATRLFVVLFTCYMCYATFRMLTVPRHTPHSTCYICSLAFFDSSTPGREPPHSTCYLCYLPFFDCSDRSPHFPRCRGFGFSDSLVPACHVARVASKSTCLLLCTSRFNARHHHMVEPHQGNMWCLAAYTPQSLKRTNRML